jgi:2',3'-cyclic-nucleotide 2'-phosphodiesterase (5'-nucleotidase family)
MFSKVRRLHGGLVPGISNVVLGVAVVIAAAMGACDRRAQSVTKEVAGVTAEGTPTAPSLRLYVASTLAGAMEPCGCRKDMLGGVDHAAALIKQGASEASDGLVLAAGPLFFMEPEVNTANQAKDQQDRWKADAIATAVSKWGLEAWSPGVNDFGRGPEVLEGLRRTSGAALLASNLKPAGTEVQATRLVERAGIKVGITGVTVLGASSVRYGQPGSELALELNQSDPATALRTASKELDVQGAVVKVVLISAARGEALRLLEKVPEFDVAIVGKAKDAGENNDAPTPPALVGRTLVVQGPNHLQAMPIVDLFIRGDKTVRKEFGDASGISTE